VRVDEDAHRGERAGIGALLELRRQERDGVVVAEGGEGGVERVRQHARLHAIVDDVGEDVAVDGVALAKEGEARVERERARARHAADDLARDALRAVLSVDDGLRDRGVGAVAEPG
jgi:hypothetical protein